MLDLYHNDTSTCAQKVRVTLAEKSLAWNSIHLDLRRGDQQNPKYLKLNPRGVVPTLVDHGRAVRESTVSEINRVLADPQAKARFAGLGAEPEPMSRTAFEAHLKKQVARWAMIIKQSGVSTD